MANNKSYMIAGGCSWADPHYKQADTGELISWKTWPRLLGQELGYDTVINVGKAGLSNLSIINKIFDVITTRGNPEIVFLGLTGYDRGTIWGADVNHSNMHIGYQSIARTALKYKHLVRENTALYHHTQDSTYTKIEQYFNNDFKDTYEQVMDVSCIWSLINVKVPNIINNTFRPLWHLYNYCNSNNIKLCVFQSFNPHPFSQVEIFYDLADVFLQADFDIKRNSFFSLPYTFFETLSKNSYVRQLQDNEQTILIGYPFHSFNRYSRWKNSDMLKHINNIPWGNNDQRKEWFGGEDLHQDLMNNNVNNQEFQISETDGHPSKLGQQLMTKWILHHAKDLCC